jgi:hypothetical protein
MFDHRVMGVVVLTRKLCRVTNIEVVREPGTRAAGDTVIGKFTVLDQNRASGDVAFQDTVLIVVKMAIFNRPVLALLANSGTVAAIRLGYGSPFHSTFITVKLLPETTQVPLLCAASSLALISDD